MNLESSSVKWQPLCIGLPVNTVIFSSCKLPEETMYSPFIKTYFPQRFPYICIVSLTSITRKSHLTHCEYGRHIADYISHFNFVNEYLNFDKNVTEYITVISEDLWWTGGWESSILAALMIIEFLVIAFNVKYSTLILQIAKFVRVDHQVSINMTRLHCKLTKCILLPTPGKNSYM